MDKVCDLQEIRKVQVARQWSSTMVTIKRVTFDTHADKVPKDPHVLIQKRNWYE